MESLLEVLTQIYGTKNDAEHVLKDMKERVEEGEAPEDLLYDEGLEPEPNYVMDLL